MGRKSIFEEMEREIDFTQEYYKFENIICFEFYYGIVAQIKYTINDCFEKNFRNWKNRNNFVTLKELREHLGFRIPNQKYEADDAIPYPRQINITEFFVYCELILNLIFSFSNNFPKDIKNNLETIIETMKIDLVKLNHTIIEIEKGKWEIIENDRGATAVADIVQSPLSNKVFEYNHFLLKGDIQKKKEILLALFHKLEPKENNLNRINNSLKRNLWCLFNNLNLRHNNIEESSKDYRKVVAKMDPAQLEEWYDDTYQLTLLAFLEIDNQERNNRIEELKSHFE
ncbi:MAG: hypothetical protein AB9907_10265 [Flexilinea sp.]